MMYYKSMLAAGLAITATCVVAWAQGTFQRTYIFHSTAQSGCPALDWHLVADTSTGALDGMLAWDNMKSMAHAVGTLNLSAKTFEVTAHEVGGQGRTAMINGTLRSDGWLMANITGPNIDCRGIAVPWYTPTPGGGN
jgi:hypothetical protein